MNSIFIAFHHRDLSIFPAFKFFPGKLILFISFKAKTDVMHYFQYHFNVFAPAYRHNVFKTHFLGNHKFPSLRQNYFFRFFPISYSVRDTYTTEGKAKTKIIEIKRNFFSNHVENLNIYLVKK